MPVPNSKSLKAQFDDAMKTYKENGPGFAVRHVIESNGLTAEDVALAWLSPSTLDEQSMMTDREKEQFDADMAAQEEAAQNKVQPDREAAADAHVLNPDSGKEPIVGGDANPNDIDGKSSTSERLTATAKNKTQAAGPAGGDLNPNDGGEKKPPVGGDVAKAPKK